MAASGTSIGAAVVSGLATLVLLTGCTASPVDPGTPTSPAEPTPSDGVETTETITTGLPKLGDLVIDEGRLGPLILGTATPDPANTESPLIWDPDFCTPAWQGLAEPPEGFTDPGMWVANYQPTTPALAAAQQAPFQVVVHDAVIDSILVRDPALHTSNGIHVGSTRAELEAAYGTELDLVTDDPAVDIYNLERAGLALSFEVLTQEGVLGPEYPLESVIWIWIRASSADIESSIIGSDAGPNGCGVA